MAKVKKSIVDVNPTPRKMLKLSGLMVPILLFLYGLMVTIGYIDTGREVSLETLLILSGLFACLGVYIFFSKSINYITTSLKIIVFHLFAIAYIILISGIAMPFTLLWILLMIASHLYFDRSGLYLSILAFVSTGIGDVMVQHGSLSALIDVGLYMFSTLILGLVVSIVYSSLEVDRKELIHSRHEEMIQRERAVTLINNMADAVISTDKNYKIQMYNAACLNLLDTNDSLEELNIDSALTIHTIKGRRVHLSKELKQSKSISSREDLVLTIGEEKKRLSLIYAPIHSPSESHNSNDGFVIILRDITRQKSLEEEKDEFISVTSHELRTPITIAEGSLSNLMLVIDKDEIPRNTLEKSARIAHEQVLYLAKMVNDLSTLSRAERGVADGPEYINVRELTKALYEEYLPQAKARGLTVDLNINCTSENILTSRLYIKELLQNFVTNAIKYTDEGGITISVEPIGKDIKFSISDTGIGLSKTDQARIFDKFWRSEDYRTRETGGTGLGLYVAAKLASKLNTKIEIASRLNHGSIFSFKLPKAED